MLTKFQHVQVQMLKKIIKSANIYFYKDEIQIDIRFSSIGYAKLFQKGLPELLKGAVHGTSRITDDILTIKIK